MKTKNADKPEDEVAKSVTVADKPVAAKPAPVAAKPLVKAAAKPSVKSTAAVAKPLVKKAKPVAQVVAPVKAVVKEEGVKEVKAVKKAKLKVVRDSFTMPQSEYQKIADIKELCLKSGVQVKKSEVLRAGVIALCAMNEAQLNSAMGALDKIKTGRPNKH